MDSGVGDWPRPGDLRVVAVQLLQYLQGICHVGVVRVCGDQRQGRHQEDQPQGEEEVARRHAAELGTKDKENN